MKAAVVEAAGHLAIRDLPEPTPGDYDVLCEILYGSVCSGTDRHIVAGTCPYSGPFPTILGHESIGRAVKCGPKVRYIEPGDLITRVGTPAVGDCSSTWGGFAEFGIAQDYRAARDDEVPAARWAEGRRNQVLPDGMDPAVATLFITWRETLSYSNRIGFGEGRNILVVGSGGNGLAFVAHATNANARQRVMIGSPRRKEIALRAGVSHFIDYKSTTLAKEISAVAPGGYDIVIDSLGRKGSGDFCVSMITEHGVLGVYGLDDHAEYTVSPNKTETTFSIYGGHYDEPETHNQVLQLYQDGELDPSIWLDPNAAFSLAELDRAIEAAESGTQVKPLVKIRG
ncbi:MAG: zinc-binding dehydrogenase [Verrucomicrobia bacterium]|nr:zinc-binding dehydrogenase [Verrucomicrobiota bacterium]MDA1087361.1 zinc-binding dehydrogenase [Verrucomicrobiota bacterium]